MRLPRRRTALAVGAAAAVGAGALAALRLRSGRIVRALAPRPGERLVGAGAHAGLLAAEVAERLWPGGELALVDVPETAADEAHEHGLESVTLVDRVDFEPGSFDGAYVVGLTDFDELRRVLRPGARVVVGDPSLHGAAASAGLVRERGIRFVVPI